MTTGEGHFLLHPANAAFVRKASWWSEPRRRLRRELATVAVLAVGSALSVVHSAELVPIVFGRETTGRIVATERKVESTVGEDRPGEHRTRATYTFTTAGGELHRGTDVLAGWDARVGDEVPVFYATSNPERNLTERPTGNAIFFGLLPLLLIAPAYLLGPSRSSFALARAKLVLPGRVDACTSSRFRSKKESGVALEIAYSFAAPDGRPAHGKARCRRTGAAAAQAPPASGTPVWVLFAPPHEHELL